MSLQIPNNFSVNLSNNEVSIDGGITEITPLSVPLTNFDAAIALFAEDLGIPENQYSGIFRFYLSEAMKQPIPTSIYQDASGFPSSTSINDYFNDIYNKLVPILQASLPPPMNNTFQTNLTQSIFTYVFRSAMYKDIGLLNGSEISSAESPHPQVASGDLSVLFDPQTFNQFGAFANDNFSAFLKSFSTVNQGANAATKPFEKYLKLFMSPIATLQHPSQSYYVTSSNPLANAISYEAIFDTYSPIKDPVQRHDAFVAQIQQFYTDQVAANGYFVTGQPLDSWINAVKTNVANLFPPSYQASSLDANNGIKVQVLNRIIMLLIQITQSLENIGIAQANRVTFLTKYQNAYTVLQNQVPVFLAGDPGIIGSTATQPTTGRNELNSAFNSTLTQNLQALRQIQQDNAKQVQSNINQTNDAVNQQSDMCTTFIQQLSSLLSTILRP